MSSSVWLALSLALAAVWVLLRLLRRQPSRPRHAQTSGVYAPETDADDVQSTSSSAAPIAMDMRTSGFLRITSADHPLREEPLPASPLGEGEFPMGLWVAPDHTVFAVGKQYTGRPGPDDGVVWQRAPDGTWSTGHRLRGRVFGAIAGRSSHEVVVGAIGGIVCFDGARWRDISLPYPMMWKVWLDGPELIAQAWDGSSAFIVRDGVVTACAPRHEPDRDHYACDIDGTHYFVFDRSEEVPPAAAQSR